MSASSFMARWNDPKQYLQLKTTWFTNLLHFQTYPSLARHPSVFIHTTTVLPQHKHRWQVGLCMYTFSPQHKHERHAGSRGQHTTQHQPKRVKQLYMSDSFSLFVYMTGRQSTDCHLNTLLTNIRLGRWPA